MIVAHRGASHDAPENTVAAFNLAWKQGADAIEGDFRLTADGYIVCIHDSNTKRTTDKNLCVSESTFKNLRMLDAGKWKGKEWADERIPSLPEVLTTVPDGQRIFIEIKCGNEIIPALKKNIIDSTLNRDQIAIISFDKHVLAACRESIPTVKTLWLTEFKKQTDGEITPSVEMIIDTLKDIRADGVNCRAHSIITARFTDRIKEEGKEVHTWTIDSESEAKRLINCGVDSITTNRPDLFCNAAD